MDQNNTCDHVYKGYIQYYSPIGLWLFALTVIFVIEFDISDSVLYMLGLIATSAFLIPILIDALSERKWKPQYWVDLNEYRRSHRKADNFFIFQMILAGCSIAIYIGIRMYRSASTADERSDVIVFVLFMIILIVTISAIQGYSFKAMSKGPNVYYRFMNMEFNTICKKFDEALEKSNLSFSFEFHQKSFSAPTYKRYFTKGLNEGDYGRIEIFLEPDKEGSKASMYYIFDDEIERAEELKNIIDLAIEKRFT